MIHGRVQNWTMFFVVSRSVSLNMHNFSENFQLIVTCMHCVEVFTLTHSSMYYIPTSPGTSLLPFRSTIIVALRKLKLVIQEAHPAREFTALYEEDLRFKLLSPDTKFHISYPFSYPMLKFHIFSDFFSQRILKSTVKLLYGIRISEHSVLVNLSAIKIFLK